MPFSYSQTVHWLPFAADVSGSSSIRSAARFWHARQRAHAPCSNIFAFSYAGFLTPRKMTYRRYPFQATMHASICCFHGIRCGPGAVLAFLRGLVHCFLHGKFLAEDSHEEPAASIHFIDFDGFTSIVSALQKTALRPCGAESSGILRAGPLRWLCMPF